MGVGFQTFDPESKNTCAQFRWVWGQSEVVTLSSLRPSTSKMLEWSWPNIVVYVQSNSKPQLCNVSEFHCFCRKYLRDTDRQELAKLAWRYTTETVEASLPGIHGEDDAEKRMDYLMTVHKIWNYGKVAFKPQLVNGMLSRAYRAFRQGKVLICF